MSTTTPSSTTEPNSTTTNNQLQQLPAYESIPLELNPNDHSEIEARIRNAYLNMPNLQLRIYFSWLQGAAIIGSIFALMFRAFQTTKVLIAINFLIGFLGIILFNIGVELAPISSHILILLVFFIMGLVAGANGSRFGFYMSATTMSILFLLLATFIIPKRTQRVNASNPTNEPGS